MKMKTAILALFLSLSCSHILNAQGPVTQEERDAKYQEFKATLEKIDNLFFKESVTQSGAKYVQLMWEGGGETSKITIEMKHLGHYGGDQIFGLLAYSTVAQTEGTLPPAVIKSAIVKNETTGLGYFSMNEAFNTVFFNSTLPSDNLTAGQIWMVCAYIHDNRVAFKKQIDEITAASN